jgi:hypothetical protein
LVVDSVGSWVPRVYATDEKTTRRLSGRSSVAPVLGRASPALDFSPAALLLGALEVQAAASRGRGTWAMPLLVVELGHRYSVLPHGVLVNAR